MAIADLRSATGNSFRSALRRVCDEVEDTFRVEIEPQFGGGDAEHTERIGAATAATREALVNAAKHSHASRIDVYAEVRGGVLTINVRDRGRGFDDGSRKTGGGLDHSLLERMRAVGGSATVVSAPGQGTEVTITMDITEGNE